MRNKLSFLLLLLLCSNFLLAQTPTRLTIKGTICDTAGISIPSATIQLLSAKDSSLVSFTQANENGNFEIKNIKNSEYLLMVTHISYIPYQRFLSISETDPFDFGKIKLKVISKQLLEVVIKAARAPLKFRGDTVEYDAASFKVPPGSTVEDLLRRLPGLEVDADGNIKSQGKDIKRLYVEGKTFFGDDPKFATKNLGAETISKVQVFDEKSEQSKLTGIDDGVKDNKAMNLKLKEEYKKGAFGKLTAAVGDQNRWALKGNYNKFDKLQQLSFIGFGNNINQTGVNWDDYSEFKGQSFSMYDNGDFGFDNNTYYFSSYGSGLQNYFDGRGLTDNYGSGVNYNFDNKKTKLNASYSYNETTRKLFQSSNKETFLQTSSFKNADTTQSKDFRGNHNIGFRIEKNIDTTNILIAKANINFTNSKTNNSLLSLYSDANDIATRNLTTVNDNKINSWTINSAAIFRHRLKKKGANFAWSGGLNSSKSDGLDNPFSINKFFEANTFTEQVRNLSTNNNNTSTEFKSSMLLTEPLSKVIYFEAFYNFGATNNIQDNLTQNKALQNIQVDSLTAYYSNNILYNRLGTTLRYSGKGLNATIGLAAQQYQLKGNYSLRNDMPDLQDPINKTWSNLIPNLSLRYQITKAIYLSTNYSFNIQAPTMNQLMPIVNVNNPAFIIQGNPDLQPSRLHNFYLSSYYSNAASMMSMYLSFNYMQTENAIANNQTITMVDKVGMQTVTRPENMKGFDNWCGFNGQISFPLIKTKLTMSAYGSLGFGITPGYINNIENVTKNTRSSLSGNFNLTPSPKLVLSMNGSISFNDVRYSIRNDLNQKVKSYSSNSTLKWQFATKSYFESSFNYSVYENKSFGFDQKIPLWNASVRQILGKANRIELRLAAFDIFNKNKSISQSASENYVIRTSANTLARYFMLSFSYNIKGFDLKNSNRGY